MKFKDWIEFTDIEYSQIVSGASSRCFTDKPTRHPIGIHSLMYSGSWSGRPLEAVKSFKGVVNSKLCYCNVGRTDPDRNKLMDAFYERKPPFVTFEGTSCFTRGDPLGEPAPPIPMMDYLRSLLSHKFCVSPPGNGIDCHRHFEAIMTKGIPIIQIPDEAYCQERWGSPCYIKEKYAELPVLWTEDYSELSEEYLESEYLKILNQSFDFSRLYYSYWKKISPDVIRNSQTWLPDFRQELH